MQINEILSESKVVARVKSNNRKVNAQSFKRNFTAQLMPVQLDPEVAQAYEDTFYPRFDNKSKYNAAIFTDISKYLAKLQFGIDALHTFAIELCDKAVSLTALAAQYGDKASTYGDFKFTYEQAIALFPPLASQAEPSMRLLRAAMNDTSNVIIQDSHKFSGGKAVINVPFDTKYAASPALKVAIDDNNTMPSTFRVAFHAQKNRSGRYVYSNVLVPAADGAMVSDGDMHSPVKPVELPMYVGGNVDDNGRDLHDENDSEIATYYAKYKMPLSVAVITVLQKLHEVVGALSNKSVVNTVPFDYDFSVFDKMLAASHPSMPLLMPESGFFFASTGMTLPPEIIDTFSIGMRLHLSKRVLDLIQSAQPLGEDKKDKRDARVAQMKATERLKALGGEYKALSASMMVGYQMDIKSEFVSFITQGHDDKAVFLLNTWVQDWVPSLFRFPGSKNGKGFAKAIDVQNLARTVSLPSDIAAIRKVRDKFGFLSTDSVGDEDGVVVNEDGSFSVNPRYSEIDIEDVKKTEGLLNNNIVAVFNRNLPAAIITGARADSAFAYQRAIDASDDENLIDGNLKQISENHKALKDKVSASVTLSDPSMHLIGNISPTNPYNAETKTKIAKNAGTMEHADILGYDFSKEGESTLVKHTSDALRLIARRDAVGQYDNKLMRRILDGVGMDIDAALTARRRQRYGNGADLPTTDANKTQSQLMSIVVRICSSYTMLEKEGLCPPLATLVAEAVQTVKDTYPDFQGESVNDSPLDEGHYTEFFAGLTPAEYDSTEILAFCFEQALLAASGFKYENLYKLIIAEMGNGHDSINERIREHPAGIDISLGLGELSKLNNYFGGALFFHACAHIAKADRKALFNLTRKSPSELKIGCKPSGEYLTDYLLPAALIFAKDIHRAEEYWDKAKEEQAKSDPDSKNRDPEHMKIYGSKGFQYFPHQWSAMKSLMGFPEYAILDIAPGGGKTHLGLTDMMMIASAMLDEGKRLKPVVVAPNGLVKNWCTDLKISTKGWNVIPIRNDTLERWNMEALVKLITNAPPNTIVVVANHFLSNANQSAEVNIGGESVTISSTTEFVTRLGFNYVILDESHKAKNLSSQLNKSLRKIFNAPTMLYKRIATGTLYPDRVVDAVGQASLLSPAILGTKPRALSTVTEEGKLVTKQLTLDDINKITDDTERAAALRAAGKAIRNRLNAYTALITKRKKDWSYILPSKIDTFILVKLHEESVPDSELHEAAYQQVVEDANKTLAEEASKREKENKAKAKRIKTKLDKDDDGGDDDEDDDEDYDPETEGMDAEFAKMYAASGGGLVRTKFDALEMLITNPTKHETAIQMWKDAGKNITKFVSSKLRAMIQRIDLHFQVSDYDKEAFDKQGSGGARFNWVEGCAPYELDICVYNGQMYLARKLPPEIGEDGRAKMDDMIKRRRLPPSTIPPAQDLDHWKPEREGKILIITSFHSTIAAIENALPQKYKAQTVTFHGGNSKAKNERALDQFNNDPNIKIIIAMEKSITEGYNMQAGSRMIRIDNPWNSGTYEQTVSRIMRPDHKGFNFEGGRDGDMEREVINVDWIMADGTIDVGKVAMLQQKTIETDMMYEDDNPNYQGVLEYLSLAKINLGVSEILKGDVFQFGNYKKTHECTDPKDLRWRHFEARAKITNIQAYEFAELRRTNPPVFVDIEAQAPHPTFRILENLPVVPGQEPSTDGSNYGLNSFYNWYRQQDEIDPWPTDANTPAELNRSGTEIRSRVVGLPVTTEYGNGIIIAINQINRSDILDGEGKKIGYQLAGIPFNKIRVEIGTGKAKHNVDVDCSLVYVATNVTDKEKKIFLTRQPSISAGNVDGEEEITMTDEESRNLPEDTPRTVTVTPSSTKADDDEANRKAVEAQAKADARKAAQAGSSKVKIEGKIAAATAPDASGQRPVNPKLPDVTDSVDVVPETDMPDVTDGVGVVPETTPVLPTGRTRPVKVKPTLDVQAMVYNGMVALYVNDGSREDDEEDPKLTQYGFTRFNSFAYIDLHNGKDFFKVIDHLENEDASKGDLFTLDKPSENRLNHIQYAFEHKNAMKFNYMTAYANREDMVDFFRTLHRKVVAKSQDTQLKLYPAFMGDRIRLMVDMTTCPAAKKLINHKYAGIQAPFGKWSKHAPMYVNFETTPRKAVTLLNKLASKFDINGLEALTAEVLSIKVKPEAEDKQ
jgi:superfamily II DNA or RNA helicase